MKTSICPICGKQFEHSRRQTFCKEPHMKICEICGNEYEVPYAELYRYAEYHTCRNKECVNARRNSKIKEVLANKPRGYNQHKTPYAKKSAEQKEAEVKERAEHSLGIECKCQVCGATFIRLNAMQKYCRQPRIAHCIICNDEIPYLCGEPHNDTCGKPECFNAFSSQKQKNRSTEEQKQIFAKMKNTMLERYGSEWYTQTEEYKEKSRKTCLQKYGVEHHLQAKEVIDKRTSTVQEKYGVGNIFQSDYAKTKSKETCLKRYGVEYATQSDVVQDRIADNNIAKYGVKHPMMLPEFIEKSVQTNILRYGRKAYTQQHIKNIEQWYEFIDEPRMYIQSHYSESPSAVLLASDLGVDVSTVDVYLQKTGSIDCIARSRSHMEDEVVSWLKEIGYAGRIYRDDRTAIRPLELDIYLPDDNVAIECNPTCTHNSSVGFRSAPPSPRKYHQDKTNRCEDNDIFLFHIFGYEWTNKQDVIKSMIRNIVGCNSEKVYARKCKISEVPNPEAMQFLAANHRQGAASAKLCLGLYFEGKLVSLMTFGHMRATIGRGKEDLADCWELVRFCSELNTSVVGGANRLLQHFIREYNPVRIRSFSDRSHTRGTLYAKLGFKEVRRSDPNYVWVDVVSDVAYNRVNAQKHNLAKFLNDDTIDLSKTEKQIMEEHGFVQVYDSGSITWEWVAH